ncbi:MAG: ACP S-malonyltransferase [Sporocytophaga sp.]|uniref:ACP S-malonyltransferase n=1 Tax=Sporocytophaga sp. TaxID=2231183 RepID=UPI001B2B93E8|nr:ACP S-malonyltransferase [Sporocytophaga sp.]MBO9699894.1 ACP S-malonyltransferase [Sporocytophaga sp.]
MKRTYVFPGQGSQIKGMGGNLFDEFQELTKKADKILGYSIKELCLNDPEQKLNQTQYTQPALYVVNALSYQKKIKDGGAPPDFLAGHSLGEYNALQAAGVLSFEDGLKLVKKRGELMSQAKGGGMAAILNSSDEQIRKILTDANLSTIDIANLNSPSQIVISGLKEDINNAQPHFTNANAMFIPLNTSGAFHSRYMKDAEKEFEKVVKKTKFSKPNIPVIANVTGKPYEFDKIAHDLTSQISNCVRWTDSISYLLNQGEIEFEELGVGDVLTKLVRAIKKDYDLKIAALKEKSIDVSLEIKVEELDTTKAAQPKEEKPLVGQAGLLTAKELVDQWNKSNPIGTKVKSDFYESQLETRTEAMILFGHRAAVYMKDYNGYFDLREIKAVK